MKFNYIKKISKYKNIIYDIFINTFSFSIYIVTQQLILMPIMGKWLSEIDFANFIIYISIFSIISNTLGSELGIVRQIKEDRGDPSPYNLILIKISPIIFIISLILIKIINFNWIDAIIFSIIIILANYRLYAASIYRMNKTFNKVFIQNVLYMIGIIIGLIIMRQKNIIWIPLLLAEIISFIYYITNTDICIYNKDIKIEKKVDIKKTFIDFGIIAFITNLVTYFDRIIIYPILGTLSVNIYYSTTTMSKIVNIVINPLRGVILSWVKKDDKDIKNKIQLYFFKYSILIITAVTIVSIPLTYICMTILYSQYLEYALKIIIPISLGVGFSVATTLIKAFVLKFIESRKLVKLHMINFIIMIVIAVICSEYYGLFGFIVANTISRFILFFIYINLLKYIKKG